MASAQPGGRVWSWSWGHMLGSLRELVYSLEPWSPPPAKGGGSAYFTGLLWQLNKTKCQPKSLGGANCSLLLAVCLPRLPVLILSVSAQGPKQVRGGQPGPLWLANTAVPGSHLRAGAQPTCPAPGQTHRGRQAGGPTGKPCCVTARGRAGLSAVSRERPGLGARRGGPAPSGLPVPEAQPACGEGAPRTLPMPVPGAWSALPYIHPRAN